MDLPLREVKTSPATESSNSSKGSKPKDWQMDFDEDDVDYHNPSLLVGLKRTIMGPRPAQHAYDYYAAPLEDEEDLGDLQNIKPLRRRRGLDYFGLLRKAKWTFYRLPVFVLMFFGLIHLIVVIYGRKSLMWDDEVGDHERPDWAPEAARLFEYATDPTRDVRPIPCHSHNDYWRRVPLFDALHYGCIGVEADVWLFDNNDELFVGHSTASLTVSRTLKSLYINPLIELLEKMNPTTQFGNTKGHGVFDEDPEQTLVLLIDFKTDGRKLFTRVQKELEPLRKKGYLSHWDGNQFVSRAITVVGTGNTPFDLITTNPSYRDIFFDAPLDEMYEPATNAAHDNGVASQSPRSEGQGKTGTTPSTPDAYNVSNSYFASTSMTWDIGIPYTGRFSSTQLEKIRGQIRGAQRRGLKARFWETPEWPVSLRNYVWKTLLEAGEDILNVDHLKAAANFDWDYVGHDWVNG